MITFRLLLGVVCWTAPPGSIKAPNVAPLYAECVKVLRSRALELEILDPLETHILAKPGDIAADLKVLQNRFNELAAAPRVRESLRLPEKALVEDMLTFNRLFQKELQDRLVLDRIHAADLQAALQETEQLGRVWEAVREARCEIYYVTARRRALQQLRDLIGVDAFCSGQLPPHLPVWRIPEH